MERLARVRNDSAHVRLNKYEDKLYEVDQRLYQLKTIDSDMSSAKEDIAELQRAEYGSLYASNSVVVTSDVKRVGTMMGYPLYQHVYNKTERKFNMVIQGSNYIFAMKCGKDITTAQDVKVLIYGMNGNTIKEFDMEDVTISSDKISVTLTQEDTLAFTDNIINIEVKYLDADGLIYLSKIKKLAIDKRKDNRVLDGNVMPTPTTFDIDMQGNVIINQGGGGMSAEVIGSKLVLTNATVNNNELIIGG